MKRGECFENSLRFFAIIFRRIYWNVNYWKNRLTLQRRTRMPCRRETARKRNSTLGNGHIVHYRATGYNDFGFSTASVRKIFMYIARTKL